MTDAPTSRRKAAVLAAVCVAVFAVNLDGTIVNVALPDLTRQLGASTRDLQWVVDGYNLAFASLVLAGGSIGDRLGRRPVLVTGLLGFALASAWAATCDGPGELVAARVVMGAFAALVYPTTLSIITNTFTERSERSRAIGAWGAVTGLGVAVGPVTGGLLLAHFWWGSVFAFMTPVGIGAAALALWLVPESRQPGEARLDPPGLLLSAAGLGLLVFTIIEGPGAGWGSGRTLGGFAAAVAVLVVFVLVERARPAPMIDVALFRTSAFSAASLSVTVAFFALYGFIFLVTQYMQFVRGWGTLSTGARILPVAASIAVGSLAGVKLAARAGTRSVVVVGLILFGSSFALIAVAPTGQSYLLIVGEMVLMGLGLGLTSTPATESILSVLPPAKAGIGSAVNDATREAGGTLGVAVIGSIYGSLYLHRLAGGAVAALPGSAAHLVRSSVGAGLAVARSHAAGSPELTGQVVGAFMHGMRAADVAAAAVCLAGALGALALPGRPRPAGARSGSPEVLLAAGR